MCLILFAWKVHANFPLVLAANRDEFYERPSAPASFWEEEPGLLAGRDLDAGGTWLGITRKGRLAALTNYRDPASLRSGAPSRGHLVSGYLRSREAPRAFIDRLVSEASRYNGFSLLLGTARSLHCFSNRGGRSAVAPGIHGLSNRLLDTPWPKVERGKGGLRAILDRDGDPDPEALFELLSDRSRPGDERLPETGIGLEWERILSPIFIESPVYGTRSSTVLTVGRDGCATFIERVFHGQRGFPATSRFDFRIEP